MKLIFRATFFVIACLSYGRALYGMKKVSLLHAVNRKFFLSNNDQHIVNNLEKMSKGLCDKKNHKAIESIKKLHEELDDNRTFEAVVRDERLRLKGKGYASLLSIPLGHVAMIFDAVHNNSYTFVEGYGDFLNLGPWAPLCMTTATVCGATALMSAYKYWKIKKHPEYAIANIRKKLNKEMNYRNSAHKNIDFEKCNQETKWLNAKIKEYDDKKK